MTTLSAGTQAINKSAALRILSRLEIPVVAVEKLLVTTVVIVVYRVEGGRRCSRFVSVNKFKENAIAIRSELAPTVQIQNAGDRVFAVQGSKGVYHVDPAKGTCTCPDHAFRKVTCKHLQAAMIAA